MALDLGSHQGQDWRQIAVLVALFGLAITGALATVATASAGTWNQAVAVAPPANAAPNPLAYLDSVACPAVGSCIAVGDYFVGPFDDASTSLRPMVASQSGGVWGAASQYLGLPPNASPTVGTASLESVACPGTESCVAVGRYTDDTGTPKAMIASESDGVWGQASEVAPPAGTPVGDSVGLDSVACQPSGPCVAVGYYITAADERQAMALSQSGGVWGAASAIVLPTDAASTEPQPYLASVSCPATGACVAVGHYIDNAGDTAPMAATEAGGTPRVIRSPLSARRVCVMPSIWVLVWLESIQS
jgi:hypothetical protein